MDRVTTAGERPVKKTERLSYIDLIRVFSCFCVLMVHFNATVCGYNTFGNFFYSNSLIPNFYLGSYLGDIGVSLFFMISGSSLMLSNENTPLKVFYSKRFYNIYPAFWIAFCVATLMSFIINKGMTLVNPAWLIFSLIGCDGYFGRMGWINGSYYQVGEWFLGCIILLYIVWPLLREGLKRTPIITWVIVLGVYGALIGRVSTILFIMRLPEVLFGMTVIKYRLYKHPYVMLGVSAVIFAAAYYLSARGIIDTFSWTILFCVFLYSLLMNVSSFIRSQKIRNLLIKIGGLTYPVFLVHHWIINHLIYGFDLSNFPRAYTVTMFLVYFLLTFAAASLLNIAGKKATTAMKTASAKISEYLGFNKRKSE